MRHFCLLLFVSCFFILTGATQSADNGQEVQLKEGDQAPDFAVSTQDGKNFKLSQRKDKGWTVLYFYPKADTPGCTKQACAFRDSIKVIRELNAEVYGVSSDDVAAQKKFHEKYHLTFPLLADPDSEVIKLYGTKMPLLKMSKRWTFLIDPKLKIRWIDHDVDPVMNAKAVADKIKELETTKR